MQLSFDRYRFVDLPDARERFAFDTRGIEVVESGLPGMVELRDALFVPITEGDPGTDSGRIGGLFDRDGQVVDAAVLRRGDRLQYGHRCPSPTPVPVAEIDEPVLYLGTFAHHFGHMLLEGMARTWALSGLDVPHKVMMHSLPYFPQLGYERILFRGLGLTPERMLYPGATVRLRSVLVPRPALIYNKLIHTDLRQTYVGVLERLGLADEPETEQPLYLSRAALGRDYRRAVDEGAFEQLLEQNGFHVFRPEQHDLREQMGVVHRHRHVFGFWGSAFRLVYFSPRHKLTCHLVSDFPWPSFLMDTGLTGADAWFVRAAEDVTEVGEVDAWRSVQRMRFEPIIDLLVSEGFMKRPAALPAPPSEALLLREATYTRARALASVHDGAGLERLRERVEAQPDAGAARAALLLAEAEVLATEEAWERAAAAARAALELDESLVQARAVLGTALVRLGRAGEAAEHLQRALDQKPDCAGAALALAECATDIDEAEAVLRRALEHAPRERSLRRRLAELLEAAGRPGDTEAVLRAGVELTPRDTDAHSELGRLLQRCGRADAALACWRQALQLDPTNPTLHDAMAKALLAAGSQREALVHARQCVVLMPGEYGYHSFYGQALLDAGRVVEAEQSLRRALQLEPDHADSHLLLAAALQHEGRRREAKAARRRGHALMARPHPRRGAARELVRRLLPPSLRRRFQRPGPDGAAD